MKLNRRGIFKLLPAALARKNAPAPKRFLAVSYQARSNWGGFWSGGVQSLARFDLPLDGRNKACLKKLRAESATYSEREMEG